MLLTLEQATYLGPARVSNVAGSRIQLALPDQEVWAEAAVAYPYETTPGDIVLVIGQDNRWYVIGILRGSGTTTFLAPGDIRFLAPRGQIELTAGNGICLRSPDVKLVANRLQFLAQTAVERFSAATRWVKNTFQLRVGRFRTRVESTYDMKAERIVERAKGDIKIDGQQIRLG